jgi:phage terminase small subunit
MRIDPEVMPDEGTQAAEVVELSSMLTHDGQRLSPKQDRFITLYIKYSDEAQAAREAGYTLRPNIKNVDLAYKNLGKKLLKENADEIAWRMEQWRLKQIADTTEILTYFTKVMRGEIKDQFDLDATIADRTVAAKELYKRLHEKELEETGALAGVNAKEIRLVLKRD